MKSVLPLPAVLGCLLAMLASGCASTDAANAPGSDLPRSQRDYTTTGSNIPNKKPLPEQSDIEREKTVERMKELQQTSVPVRTKE